MRVSDTYLHVPGFHPSINNPVFFEQRVDDPSVLPSLHKHLWGRLASLGCLTLQLEKKLHLRHRTSHSSLLRSKSSEEGVGGEEEWGDGEEQWSEGQEGVRGEVEGAWGVEEVGVDFGDEPAVLSGEARSVMLEWSRPSVVTLAKTLDHCQREYAELVTSLSSSASSLSLSFVRGEERGRSLGDQSLPVHLQFQLRDINVFMYGMSPGRYVCVCGCGVWVWCGMWMFWDDVVIGVN